MASRAITSCASSSDWTPRRGQLGGGAAGDLAVRPRFGHGSHASCVPLRSDVRPGALRGQGGHRAHVRERDVLAALEGEPAVPATSPSNRALQLTSCPRDQTWRGLSDPTSIICSLHLAGGYHQFSNRRILSQGPPRLKGHKYSGLTQYRKARQNASKRHRQIPNLGVRGSSPLGRAN